MTDSAPCPASEPQIMAAPNGARKTKADHPALPMTIAETLACARACHAAGATALHLHVRDASGRHSIDAGLYREALAELERAVPGMAVQVTTESGGIFDVAAQYALLRDLRPGWASLSLREAARDRALAQRLYALCRDQGTRLQHIVFDADDAALLADWQARGILGLQESVILVLGRYRPDMQSDPGDLGRLLDSLPPVGRWMLCAFGRLEHACLMRAAALGGDVRVGFENSHQRQDGTPWPEMSASVRALAASLAAGAANRG